MARNEIVDLHAHFIPGELIDQVERGVGDWEMASRHEPNGLILRLGERDMLCPRPGLYSVPDRIADMDRTDVSTQVMSAAPFLFYYWADAALATRMTQITNESMARAAQEHPGRLFGLASVPLSAPDHLDQARSAIEDLGLHGFALGTECNGEQVDGPRFRGVFRLAAELDVPIFFHPFNRSAIPELQGSYLVNLIGNPMATTIALGRFTFSGVLDEHPHLRTVWAHLGGYSVLALSRLEHGASVRSEASGRGLSPREVFSRIWIDGLNHDVRAVKFAADVLGAERLVIGTDYCFDMGVDEPRQQVDEIARLDSELAERIAWRNAHDILPEIAG